MIDKYLAKAGLLIKPEQVKKVLIANEIEEKDWEIVISKAVNAYMEYRSSGNKVRFLEVLSDMCYSLKRNKQNTGYIPIGYNPVREMPPEISKNVPESNAIVYDRENKKIFIKGSIKDSSLYVLYKGELRKLRNKVGLPELIEFVISIIR